MNPEGGGKEGCVSLAALFHGRCRGVDAGQ